MVKFQICIDYREWAIIAETFEFDKYYEKQYDHKKNVAITRQAGQGNIPLYLHDVGVFDPEYLLETLENLVTSDSISSIFDKENLTFREMIQEIWKRRDDIIKPTEGDINPYEGNG